MTTFWMSLFASCGSPASVAIYAMPEALAADTGLPELEPVEPESEPAVPEGEPTVPEGEPTVPVPELPPEPRM